MPTNEQIIHDEEQVIQSPRAETRLNVSSPVDPGIGRGVMDLYPSRGYTHPVTRAIEYHTQLAKLTFDQKFLFGRSHTHSSTVCFSFSTTRTHTVVLRTRDRSITHSLQRCASTKSSFDLTAGVCFFFT